MTYVRRLAAYFPNIGVVAGGSHEEQHGNGQERVRSRCQEALACQRGRLRRDRSPDRRVLLRPTVPTGNSIWRAGPM